MHPKKTSRRTFTTVAAGLAAAQIARPQDPALTVADVIERIKANVGVPWAEQTVDNIIAGSPEAKVRGIATTMMATLDVIQRAAAAHLNLVVTHEPTFYSHQDATEKLTDDSTYQFKDAFLREHDVAVFRFHDHWHRRRPDGIALGMARELGWRKYADADNSRQFTLPATTLAELSRQVQSKLSAATARVVGDPELKVEHVRASWGYASQFPSIPMAADPGVDVFVCGETREWELVEYVQDAIAAGKKKGLIVIGHVASEQAGMKYCAEWLREFVSEVPVKFVPAAEPFWTPDAPRA